MYNQFNSRKETHLFISIILTTINLLIIASVDLEVLLSYFYTTFLFLMISFLLGIRNSLLINYTVLSIYTTLGLLLYLAQLYIVPDGHGFSGNYGGIATDDRSFFAGLADSTEFIPFAAYRYIGKVQNFVTFLKLLYPFNIRHPLSIIIPNLLGICFIPFFTKKAAQSITKNKKVGNIAFLLVLFCPLILANGLILMRDGWTAFLLILGFYYLVNKKIIGYILALALLLYLRMGSGLVLAFMSIFYFNHLILSGSRWLKFLKIGFISIFFLFFMAYGLAFVQDYLILKGVTGLEREGFVETKIKNSDSSSIIYAIYSLPIYLKFPVGFIFFLFLPFFSPKFYVEGLFNIRGILYSVIMPILLIFYFKYFVSGFLYVTKNKNKIIKKAFYLFFFSILLISQASIQPRHKTTIMPIFYILVSYGIYNNNNKTNKLGGVFIAVLLILQFIMFIF